MAVMMASPSATALTWPVASTETTAGFEEVNFALPVKSPSIFPAVSASTRSRWPACGPDRTTLAGRILISAADSGETSRKARILERNRFMTILTIAGNVLVFAAFFVEALNEISADGRMQLIQKSLIKM